MYRGGEYLREWRAREFGEAPPKRQRIESEVEGILSDVPSEEMLSDLIVDSNKPVEEVSKTFNISGRRIVNIGFFIEQFVKLSEHAPQFGCSLKNVRLIKEIKRGLISGLVFSCDYVSCERNYMVRV